MKKPLLRMLWCVSVAPLGVPVVPEVNWMLIGVVELQQRAARGERGQSAAAGAARDRVEGERARRGQRADLDHRLERGQARGTQPAGRAVASSGAKVSSIPA